MLHFFFCSASFYYKNFFCWTIIANKKWYLISLAWMLRVLSLLDSLGSNYLIYISFSFCFIRFCIPALLLFNIKLHPRADVLLFLILYSLFYFSCIYISLFASYMSVGLYFLTFILIFIFHYTNSFCAFIVYLIYRYTNTIIWLNTFVVVVGLFSYSGAFKKSWLVTYILDWIIIFAFHIC